jgi:hypothetical protein
MVEYSLVTESRIAIDLFKKGEYDDSEETVKDME